MNDMYLNFIQTYGFLTSLIVGLFLLSFLYKKEYKKFCKYAFIIVFIFSINLIMFNIRFLLNYQIICFISCIIFFYIWFKNYYSNWIYFCFIMTIILEIGGFNITILDLESKYLLYFSNIYVTFLLLLLLISIKRFLIIMSLYLLPYLFIYGYFLFREGDTSNFNIFTYNFALSLVLSAITLFFGQYFILILVACKFISNKIYYKSFLGKN